MYHLTTGATVEKIYESQKIVPAKCRATSVDGIFNVDLKNFFNGGWRSLYDETMSAKSYLKMLLFNIFMRRGTSLSDEFCLLEIDLNSLALDKLTVRDFSYLKDHPRQPESFLGGSFNVGDDIPVNKGVFEYVYSESIPLEAVKVVKRVPINDVLRLSSDEEIKHLFLDV